MDLQKTLTAAVEAFRDGTDTSPIYLVTAGFSSDSVSYGTAAELGLMERGRVRGWTPDNMDIEWSLTKKAEGLVFTRQDGTLFSYPDHYERWEK